MWGSVTLQWPAAAGESLGRRLPSTSLTGFEKVRRSGLAGEICVAGAGLATTTGLWEAGNQLTVWGAPRRSQLRAALATSIVPAAVVRWIATVSALGESVWRASCPAGP